MKILLVDQIAKVNYKYSFSLAEAIKKQGNEVVLAIDRKKESEHCTCRMINLFNTDEKNIGKIKKLFNYIASYRAILRELKSGGYDIVHTQWLIFSPIDYFFLRRIVKKCKVKLVVTIHDILPFNQKFYDFRYHKKVYGLADKVIVQAENNVKRFGELFPDMTGKSVMIPHGHFLDYAEPMNMSEARERLNIQKNALVFLFFGQIKKVKGVGVLLEAFSKMCREYPDALLIIAGSVWKDDFSQYQEIIDRTGISDAVRTDIRYIPDEEIKYYYSACDCCVLPYLDVYQSGVIQLCYAYRKPVVATRIGAFKEVVLEGESGFLCEPNDAEDLAAGMKTAIEKRADFEKMGSRGYEYIAKKFSWDKIAADVTEIYSEV
ncbi:MAG: glycosyltransferase family 4 protein [Lachnospiraceae bacterium]|nr:glycosyltransferase family 4 protein [Lachnospiraceae bacterium]MCR5532171.1 glycosyltransferase family 4 protein [Lachnospiraceae bacterium]